MPRRRDVFRALAGAGLAGAARGAQEPPATGAEDRAYWVDVLGRVADPVLNALAEGRLKRDMPVEAVAKDAESRRRYSHLEAFGRLMTGVAPWLELGPDDSDEGRKRAHCGGLARKALDAATDPASPDFLNFREGSQPLVDAAFLAHAIVRAPKELWGKLSPGARANVAAALRSSRAITPGPSNWLLFSAMVEAALCSVGEGWDALRVEYAVRQHEQWYKGDGVYGDGAAFHWDYYNSFVIQPMLVDVLETVARKDRRWKSHLETALPRARRYAAIQERLISPEGTFPAIGRSLAYRFGAFQLLGQVALRRELPEPIRPAQVRCALTAVIRRMIEAPGTFDDRGWLRIGFCGAQPGVAEGYISTGSLYLCAAGLVPLGLPPSDEFWSAPPEDWTARRIWSGSGRDVAADHAIGD